MAGVTWRRETVATILLVGLALAGQAQATLVSLKLTYGATLTMRRISFRPADHKLTYSQAMLVAINGRRFFGTDGELPRYELASASLLLHGIRYQLPVSQMYNPWFGQEPWPRLFRLARRPQGYLLWAMFSDGAGGYTAKWLLTGNTARRILLSDDEQYCF